jgi:hypothetical protein
VIFLLITPFLFYIFDGLVVVALIHALGNEELDFTGSMAVGVGTVVASVFLDLMLAHQFGVAGYFSGCLVTALALGTALKLLWDVELKRVVLICLFFCAFHFGMLRLLVQWLG